MKKLMMIAVVTLASASAFASKARLSALSYNGSNTNGLSANAPHLIDTQTIFVNPADLTTMGSWATFETGSTDATPATTPNTAPNAEAGFARASGDARWGFYLGHGTVASFSREQAAPTIYLIEENPINLFYAAKMADISWGLGLNYSASDKKTTGVGALGKQSTTGITGGMRMGPWDASLGLGVVDTAEVGTNKWTGKMNADLRAGYAMDTWYFYGQYAMTGGKHEVGGAATTEYDNNAIRIGAINTTKVDGGEFFWGASYLMDKVEQKVGAGTKTESNLLPVVVGIEADAASWLVLRGSVTQTVLLSSVKNATDTRTKANDTTVAAGAGIKFNKFTLDGSLAGSTTGQINGGSLLANAGLTYNF
ncbi:MAG: hypothetical protein EOP04_17275 [Proteobacteria bacterium]|nr:MAG: hypothetical protein EOP04_17275 [Pseudomonadota bacterium]